MSRRRITAVAKGYRPYVQAAIQQGWMLSQTAHGHAKLKAPDGYVTPIPGTGADGSLVRAFAGRLRKHGVLLVGEAEDREDSVSTEAPIPVHRPLFPTSPTSRATDGPPNG